MGLEVSGPLYLHRPENKHSTTRVYSLDDKVLFTQYVHKTVYRIPPHWYRMEWVTTRSAKEVAKSTIDFHLRLRRRFGLPKDSVAVATIEAIRDAALAEVWRKLGRSSDDTFIRAFEKNRDRIEPLAVGRMMNPIGKMRYSFCTPKIGLSRPEYLMRIAGDMVKFVPQSGVEQVKIITPFANILINEESKNRRRVVLVSRYRIIAPATRLPTQAEGIDLPKREKDKMNDAFKKPIVEILDPREAR